MSEVAGAAHVSRGTLYRHFPTRSDLVASVNERARDAAVATSEDRLRPPGELARATPTPLSVADVLNKVPPHLLGEQVVAEAMRIAGVGSAAVYLVDLEGTMLLRLAGPPSFPDRLPVTLAVGTEVPQEGLPALRAVVEDHLPGAACAPLLLRGRALGALVAVGSAAGGVDDLAYEAAAALCLAEDYTDHLDAARRVRPTSPAAEIQQNLLPPRVVRTNGALIAGNVLPGYEIRGDWFDYAENPRGTWIGIADAEGNGARAAALASVALGAFRSARHQGLALPDVIALMDGTVREISEHGTITTTIGFWVPPTSTFSWISCGELGPIVVDAHGEADLLSGPQLPPLGAVDGLGDVTVRERRLTDGDRLVLVSDGVLDRTAPSDAPLSIEGSWRRSATRPSRRRRARQRRRCGGPRRERRGPARRRDDRRPDAGARPRRLGGHTPLLEPPGDVLRWIAVELAAGRELEDVHVVAVELVAPEPEVRRHRGGHRDGRVDRVLGPALEDLERLGLDVLDRPHGLVAVLEREQVALHVLAQALGRADVDGAPDDLREGRRVWLGRHASS
jgi:AcrR family transcriptional regulator